MHLRTAFLAATGLLSVTSAAHCQTSLFADPLTPAGLAAGSPIELGINFSLDGIWGPQVWPVEPPPLGVDPILSLSFDTDGATVVSPAGFLGDFTATSQASGTLSFGDFEYTSPGTYEVSWEVIGSELAPEYISFGGFEFFEGYTDYTFDWSGEAPLVISGPSGAVPDNESGALLLMLGAGCVLGLERGRRLPFIARIRWSSSGCGCATSWT